MGSSLTPLDLRAYLTELAIDAHLIEELGETPTVLAAAAALGVDPDQIIKTLLFLVEESSADGGSPAPVVVISHGMRRVDKKPLAQHFGVGQKRVKLAPAAVVQALLGYPAGGVPPFGHRTSLPVILDSALLQLPGGTAALVYGGGGDDRTMMALTVEELLRVTRPQLLTVSP